MYKKCGDKGTTVGGDHGKETVDIAVPFFVKALKQKCQKDTVVNHLKILV